MRRAGSSPPNTFAQPPRASVYPRQPPHRVPADVRTGPGGSVGVDDAVVGDGVRSRRRRVDCRRPGSSRRHSDHRGSQQHPPPRTPDRYRCHDYLRRRDGRHAAPVPDDLADGMSVTKTSETRQQASPAARSALFMITVKARAYRPHFYHEKNSFRDHGDGGEMVWRRNVITGVFILRGLAVAALQRGQGVVPRLLRLLVHAPGGFYCPAW